VNELLAVGLGGVVMLAIVAVLRVVGAREPRRVRRRLRCPEVGCMADCVLEQDTASGCWTGVAACSLCPPGRPRCSRGCLRLLDHKGLG
jgi:hypothetical protein